MATKKKTTNKKKEEIIETPAEAPVIEEKVIIEEPKKEEKIIIEEPKKEEKRPKYSIGSIVYVSKDADADLNGFKLFPQYKKYTYTVEAYDEKSGVYTLRRLNLLLRLKDVSIVSPEEHAHDSLNRRQF